MRFNQLQRYIKQVSDKTLSQNLKELERDGLVLRTMYPQIPPRVEYSLTELGQSLKPILDAMQDWGEEYKAKNA